MHHEGTRDTSGGGESYDSYGSTGISNGLQRKRELRWKISIKSFLEILEVALEHIWRHGALDAKGIMNWSI